MQEKRQQLAGDVIKGPWDPGQTAMGIHAAKSGLAQRGMRFNEQTREWEDIQAKVLPIKPEGK
jgi:hypothetical protein